MALFNLRLLGSFQAEIEHKPLVHFPTSKVRAFLAYLAVESEQPHLRTQLAALLWGEWDEQAARANLRKTLLRLRQALDQSAPGLGDALLDISRDAVQMRPDQIAVDVLTFRAYHKQVKAHSHADVAGCTLCLERLANATALYQGDLLAGLEVNDAPQFEEWLAVQREHLYEQALASLSLLSDAYLQRDDFERGLLYAKQQIHLQPWREEAHRQAMQALASLGRREEAIAQYERCRRVLYEELGITPDPETERLLAAIQSGEAVSRVVRAAQKPARATLHNFPARLTPFIGREDAVATVQERLRDPACRLLTLLGAGGLGKTTLAVESVAQFAAAGDLFPDGCYFIPLVTATASDHVVTAIGEQLDVTFRQGADPEAQLLSAMADRAMLLVLDNYEQVAGETEFLERILAATSRVMLLITSRAPLNLRAEWRLPLSGLSVPQESAPLNQVAAHTAVQMFQSTAQRVDPGFRLTTENAELIGAICRSLAGMPLALEIAAGWLKLHSLETLARRIEAGVDFLTTQARDMPERHRSLRVVFEQSWQLLSPVEREAYARLTCFRGSFSMEAAIQVAEISVATLTTLLDHALVQRAQDDRFSLHPVLLQFANSYLESADALYDRHADWFLNRVAGAAPFFATSNAPAAIAVIRMDLDDVRSAWQWAVETRRTALLSQSLDGLLFFYQFRGYYREGRHNFAAAVQSLAQMPEEQMLVNRLRLAQSACAARLGDSTAAISLARQVVDSGDEHNRAAATMALGELHELRGEYSEAIAYLEEARRRMAEHGDTIKLAEVLDRMSRVYRSWDQLDEGIDVLSQALVINQRMGNEAGAAENHANLGLSYKDQGIFPKAIYHIEQAIALARKLNHRENTARFTQNLGLVYWQMEELEEALDCYQQALAMAEELESKRGTAMCAGGIGVIMRRLYRYDEALTYLQRALRLAEEIGDRAMQATQQGNIGNVYMNLGEYQRGIGYHERAAELDRAAGATGGVSRHLGNIGDVMRRQGRYQEALPYFEEAVVQLRQIKSPYNLSWILVSYAEALHALGRFDEAQAANEEGGRLAAELGRRPVEFSSRLLSARLTARTDLLSALAALDTLRLQFTDLEYQAEIAYAQWEFTQEVTAHRRALQLYERLVITTGKFRHRERLQALDQASVATAAQTTRRTPPKKNGVSVS